MKPDSEIALERVQSEILGALLSIQSSEDIEAAYFDRLRRAVSDAVAYFRNELLVPQALLDELRGSATTLRNEAYSFPGREPACTDMANWLEIQRQELTNR